MLRQSCATVRLTVSNSLRAFTPIHKCFRNGFTDDLADRTPCSDVSFVHASYAACDKATVYASRYGNGLGRTRYDCKLLNQWPRLLHDRSDSYTDTPRCE